MTSTVLQVVNVGEAEREDSGHLNVKEREEREHQAVAASSFFQSLQLQTVGSSQEDGGYKDQQREKLDDLSFIESIGLYWVNPADRNTEAGPSQEAGTEQAEGSSESEGKKEKSIEEPLDEFDFLNVLGLTPVTAGPGNNKRWRLWNPEVDAHTWDDDILCHDIELQETHHDTPATDPTIMEHHQQQQLQLVNSSKNQEILDIEEEIEKECVETAEKNEECHSHTNSVADTESCERPRRVIRKRRILSESADCSKRPKLVDPPSKIPPAQAGRLVECGSCGARVSRPQYGKHLVSHYHYHRSLGHPDNLEIILNNIRDIVTQSPFQCQPCRFYCNWHSDLRHHFQQETHSEVGQFWCQVCMKIIPDQKTLVSHLNSFNHTELVSVINRSVPVIIKQISLFPCKICHREFRFNLGLKKHMQISHSQQDFELENQKKFYCDYCEYFSYKVSSVKTHSFLVHPNRKLKFDCHTCKQQFLSKETVKAHRNSKTHKVNSQLKKEITDEVNCSYCSDWFLDSEDLRKHLQSQHLKDLPQCHLCGQIFSFHSELTLHFKLDCQTETVIERAAESAEYCCAQCPFSTSRQKTLRLHESYKHSRSDDATVTTKCPFCFVPIYTNLMTDHIETHHGQYFKCQDCHRYFNCETKLKEHRTACKKAIEFSCSKCNYKGASKILLNLHCKRQHSSNSEKKLYKCSNCELQFKSNSSLKNHFRNVHTETTRVAKLICEFPNCNFKCLYKSDLERHQLKHSDIRNLQCNVCEFTCKRRNELMRHHRFVHQEAPLSECSFCDYKTKNAQHLRRHIASLHKQVSCFEIHLDENDFLVGKNDL